MLKRIWFYRAPEGGSAAAAAPAAAPGAAPAAAPAATPGATGAPPAATAALAGAPAAATPGAGEPAAWYGKAELKPFVENKGFRNVDDVFTWGQNLEKLVGLDKLPMPKDETDTEGWNRVYDRLGRPKDPKDYQLPVPDGMDRGFADKFAAKFHARGLTTAQARGVAEDWNAAVTEMAAADNAQFATKSKGELDALTRELGKDGAATYFDQVNLAAQALGVTKADIKSMERSLGTRRMLDLLHKMGDGMAEDNLDGDGQGGGAMTPDAARAKVKELQADKSWVAKFRGGDAAARAEMDKLNRIIAGAQPQS